MQCAVCVHCALHTVDYGVHSEGFEEADRSLQFVQLQVSDSLRISSPKSLRLFEDFLRILNPSNVFSSLEYKQRDEENKRIKLKHSTPKHNQICQTNVQLQQAQIIEEKLTGLKFVQPKAYPAI